VQVGQLRQLLLRQITLQSQVAETPSENYAGVGGSHPAIFGA
jgi:hypothetical protein